MTWLILYNSLYLFPYEMVSLHDHFISRSNLSCQIPSTSSHHHAPLQQKSICFISPTFIFYIGKNEVSTPEKNKLPFLLIHRVDYDESRRVGGCFFAFFINVLSKNSFFLLSSSNSTFSWQLSSSIFLFTKHFIS